MNDSGNAHASASSWQQRLAGSDEAAFEALVEPHLPMLLKAAEQDLAYYIFQGDARPHDYSPQEIVGETLLQAWTQHERCPEPMSLPGWLLATQYRVLRRLVAAARSYRRRNAVSLDEPVPEDSQGTDPEWFWDWHQGVHTTWDDVIGSTQPVDVEVPIFSNRSTLRMEANPRHVLVMHDEFEMPLHEVAFAMNHSISDTARLLGAARSHLLDPPLHERPHETPE